MNPRDHALFRNYPLNGSALLSIGSVPTPYHIYDGYGVFIGGTAALAPVQALLQGEQVQPLTTEAGRALLGIWICDFVQASLDLIDASFRFSLRAIHRRRPYWRIPSDRDAYRPHFQMLCHGLWNNTPQVVAYNRELLSLNARLTISHIEQTGGTVEFSFSDTENWTRVTRWSARAAAAHALRRYPCPHGANGFCAIQIARQPSVHMQVVNPLGVQLTRNAVADAYTSNATEPHPRI